MDINNFTQKVVGFNEMTSAQQIDYIVYYLLIEKKMNGVMPKHVNTEFDNLHLPPYTNIPSYLSRFSKNGKGQKYIRSKSGYLLVKTRKEEIDSEVDKILTPEPSNDLFPMNLLDNTRGYVINTGSQACVCYDLGLYDSSIVMVRKLLETLIIEAFERFEITERIKNDQGHFYFLSDLISKFLSESSWNISRNSSNALPQIKQLGDLSAHNRRYSAKKSDLDKIKTDLRVVIEELVNLIDYPSLNASKK